MEQLISPCAGKCGKATESLLHNVSDCIHLEEKNTDDAMINLPLEYFK